MLRVRPQLLVTTCLAFTACGPGSPQTGQSGHALEAGVSDASATADAGVPDSGPADSGILGADFQIAEFTAFVSNGVLEAQVIVCNYGNAPDYFVSVDIVAQPDADPALWLPRTPDLSLTGWSVVRVGRCEALRGRAPIVDPGWDPVFIATADPTNYAAELDETNNYRASLRRSVSGAADLVITKTEWSPVGGEETNFVSEVCNQGNAASGYAGFEYFADSISLPTYYGGRYLDVLRPGECTLMAWGVSGYGSTTILPVVEVNSTTIGALPESDYSNNQSQAPFSVTQGSYDLVVRRAHLPDTLTHPSRIQAEVCNVGTQPSTLDTTMGVYFGSTPGLPGVGATAEATTTLPSLAPAECHEVELLVGTNNLTYGRTHVGLLLDATSQAADPASNNWHSAGWRVPPHVAPTPLPDLIAKPVQRLDATPGAGSFSVDICNAGDAAAPASQFIAIGRFTDLAPPAAFVPFSITGAGMTPIKGLSPGECSTIPFSYQRWPTVLNEEFVSVWIDPRGALQEHDTSNNHSDSARAVFRNGANFRLESAQRSSSDGSNGVVDETVSFRICNNGDQRGTWAGDVRYGFVDTPKVIGPPGIQNPAQQINVYFTVLDPGECIDKSFTRPHAPLPAPRFASSYLQLRNAPHVDMAGATLTLPAPTSVPTVFEVLDFSAPPVATPGQPFDVVTSLCGRGGPTTEDIPVFASRDARGEAPALYLGYWTQNVLLAGACVTRTDTVIAPVADRLSWVGLMRYGADRPKLLGAQRITFGTGVDYTSRIISAPAQASSTFSAQVEVCNPGDVAGPPSEVSLLLSWDDEFAQAVLPAALSDLVLGSAAVPGLAAGACVTATVSGDASLAPVSTRRLGSYVDYPGTVTELREDDNASAAQAFTITAPACGNGSLDANEQCDDGNLTRGDGCDELCAFEVRARQGEAIFTGSDNQRLSHAITTATHPLNPTNAFTFALWAREPARQWETLSNRWDRSGKVWSFSHDSTGVMGLAINDGSGSRGNSRAFATLPGRGRGWVHYAMTYDQGVVHLYRNGVPDDGAVRGTIPAVLSGGTSDFHLGHGFYMGAMGNVLFLDRAASAIEIADVFCALSDDPSLCSCGVDQHACSASDVVNLPGLVAYWPMTTGPQDAVGTYDLAEQGSNWVYNDRTPAAPVPDAGVLDSGLHADATIPDSGVPADSGLHPDATVPDSGAPVDSGLHPDATVPDSGVLLDTGVVADAGGSDTGQVDAGAPLVRARQGEAIYVAGRGQRLTVPIATANHPLDPADAFSFALWAREPATPWETPANRWDNPGKAWSFSHNQDGFMYLGLNDGTGSRANGRRFATRPTNNRPWVHYAMTYDRGTIHLYRNGVADDGAIQGVLPSVLAGGISDFHLGHTRYTGAMGNVTFFDRALTAADVGDLHCALSDDPSLCSCGTDQHPCSDADVLGMAGLVSYWPLTTGPQDVVGGHDFVEQGTGWIYNDRTPAPSIDAGIMDAGAPLDSGAALDAGMPLDAGQADSGPADAGTPSVNGPVQFATFNSARQQSLDVPVPAMSPLDSGAFTLAMWMRAPYLQWAAVAKRWDSQAGDVWLLSKKFPNTLFMSISGTASNGDANVGREFATPISGGEWMHVIVTYAQGTVRLYRDGLSDDGPTRGTIPATLSGALPPLSIGHRMYSGSIGSVLYYDRAVTSAEAQDIYCAFSSNPGSCPCNGPSCTLSDVMSMAGLVSYWPLNRDGADAMGGQTLSEVNGPVLFTPGGP